MKRLTALVLAAGMLVSMLASCSTPAPENDVVYNLDHISMELPQGMVMTTLEKADDVNDYYRPDPGFTTILSQQLCCDGDTMYALPQYPAEIIRQGTAAIEEYSRNYTPADYLEVYRTDDFSSMEILPLNDMDVIAFCNLAWDDSTDTIQMFSSYVEKYGDEDYETWRYIYDTEGNLLAKDRIDIHYDVIYNENFHLIGGDLYYRNHIIAGDRERPSLRVLRAGETKPEILASRIRGMCCTDGMVYYVKGTQETAEYEYSHAAALYRYDPVTEETETIAEFSTPVLFLGNLCYDSKNGILYTAHNQIIYALDTKTGEVIPVLSSLGENMSIEGCYDDKIVINTSFTKLTSYTMTEKPVSIYDGLKELRFCRLTDPSSASSLDTTASGSNAFKILYANGYKYQSATAYASDDEDEYAFTIAKKLLAGDTDFDIFYVTTEMFELFESMYFEDLSRYSILETMYDRYLPGVRGLCSVDGIPALVPVNLRIRQLCLDPSVLEDPFEVPASFRDFMKLSELNYRENTCFMKASKLHFLLSPWFEQAAYNMLADTIPDDDCLTALETLYRLGEHFRTSPKVSLKYQSGVSVLGEVFITYGAFSPYGTGEGQLVLPLPVFSEGMKQTVAGEFWAVNPNSENKEAAAIWLACTVDQNYRSSRYDAGFFNVPVTETNVSNRAVYDTMCRQIAEGIRERTIRDLNMKLYYHFKDIEAGKLTPEDAADELFRYLKMIKYE